MRQEEEDRAGPSSYDEVPYGSEAIDEMHPNRMAAVARLFGLDPAPVRTARVLEIGCAEGGNAIAVAVSLPEARVVGIDLSERQVAIGNARVSALGLSNVRLVRGDLAELEEGFGTFDYVCAHGVYSWIPPALQPKLLEACRELLAPDGIAYVSYNTLPGWRARLVLREMACARARRERGTGARVAAARRLLAAATSPAGGGGDRDRSGYRALLGKAWGSAERLADAYLAHEYLEEYNQPCWFHEFAAAAAAAGLSYVADARLGTMPLPATNPGLARAVVGPPGDPLAREQEADFLVDGSFRQSLLCRNERTPRSEPDLSALDRFHLVSHVRPESAPVGPGEGTPATFVSDGSFRLETSDPLLKGALLALSDRAPGAVALGELLGHLELEEGRGDGEAVRRLRAGLLLSFATEAVDVLDHPPACAVRAGARPLASPLARLQAVHGPGKVTSLHHRKVDLPDPVSRLVLSRLDGTRGAGEVAREVAEAAVRDGLLLDDSGEPVSDPLRALRAVEAAIGPLLDSFARSALLAS